METENLLTQDLYFCRNYTIWKISRM